MLAVAAGAILNVLFAWGRAITPGRYIPFPATTSLEFGLFSVRQPEGSEYWHCRHTMDGSGFGATSVLQIGVVTDELIPFGCEVIDPALPPTRRENLPSWIYATRHNPSPEVFSVGDTAFGFPRPAMASRWIVGENLTALQMQGQSWDIINDPLPYWIEPIATADLRRWIPWHMQTPDNGWIPLRILWPGFLVNTFFYACVLLGLRYVSLVPGRNMRECRARRHCCPSCGYSRKGLDAGAVCPECGE